MYSLNLISWQCCIYNYLIELNQFKNISDSIWSQILTYIAVFCELMHK